jgi:hypothetical protein
MPGISPKITQQKDARIRVLFNDRFCLRFSYVAKVARDPHFHVGGPEKERASDNWRTEFSDGE